MFGFGVVGLLFGGFVGAVGGVHFGESFLGALISLAFVFVVHVQRKFQIINMKIINSD